MITMMRPRFFYRDNIFILLLIIFLLPACSRQTTQHNTHLITVKSENITQHLFYASTIQPVRTWVVPSPADGVIVEMPFQYGEEVKNGQLLFMLSSTKFLTDYKSALMQYIKAKSDFSNSEAQLSEATFLHKNALISDDEFKMRKANFYGNQLALLQAKDVLKNLIRQLDIKNTTLYNLSITDVDKITQAMHLKMDAENLRVFAPATGVVLSQNKNEGENKKLSQGDTIKQGDVLAMIGDMSGLALYIKVNELSVNQLKIGQAVTITGIAFPDDVLSGEIARIDRQGEITNGGVPTFAVEIIVKQLTLEQQKRIHVGMSANVEIAILENSSTMVPLRAIKQKEGSAFVHLYDAQKKTWQEVAVKTGKTTMDSVAILAGIHAGDQIADDY